MSPKATYEELERKVRHLQRRIAVSERATAHERAWYLEQLLQVAPYGVFVLDLTGNIVLASEMAARRLGRKPEEMVGTPLAQYFPTEVAQQRRRKGLDAIASNSVQRIEDRIGDQWFYSKIMPISDDNNEVVALAVFGDDITARKHLEQQRDELVARLQAALGEIRQLSGLLPICAYCKRIRDDSGYWTQLEEYIQAHSEAEFSHGICEDCARDIFQLDPGDD